MELKDRIRAAIGKEAVAAFARRCGFGESLLRKYLLGTEPSARNLVSIADAAGVSLEWLATGRGSMRRQDANSAPDKEFPYARRLEKIGQLLAGMDEKDAAALLDELYARAQDAAKRRELERALADVRAEIERLKRRA